MYCDNKSTIQLSAHHMLRPRTKHINMRHHWIREKIAAGEVKVVYVPTAKNVADVMTKNVGRVKREQLLSGLME